MKTVKIVLFGLFVFLSQQLFAQNQKLVTIEMYEHSKIWPERSGSGVDTYTFVPFVVKTTNEHGATTITIHEPVHRRSPIETFPCLRKEMDLWLEKGFKLFSFNITPTGESSSSFRYLVLLVKEG